MLSISSERQDKIIGIPPQPVPWCLYKFLALRSVRQINAALGTKLTPIVTLMTKKIFLSQDMIFFLLPLEVHSADQKDL